jgi:hypothetical protein
MRAVAVSALILGGAFLQFGQLQFKLTDQLAAFGGKRFRGTY